MAVKTTKLRGHSTPIFKFDFLNQVLSFKLHINQIPTNKIKFVAYRMMVDGDDDDDDDDKITIINNNNNKAIWIREKNIGNS